MEPETKELRTRVTMKADGENAGSFEAVFSTFDVVDRGLDVVMPGAIENAKEVPVVWSHDWSKIIGRGVTEMQADRAVIKGQLFLNTNDGQQAYETMKAMNDLMEFSWGFMVNDYAYEKRGEQTVRVIKATELFEVSPVLVGEGRGTGLLAIKNAVLSDHTETALAAVELLVQRYKSLADLLLKEGRPISESRRTRMGSIAEALDAAAVDLRAILKETEPAKAIDADALLYDYLLRQARMNGVAA